MHDAGDNLAHALQRSPSIPTLMLTVPGRITQDSQLRKGQAQTMGHQPRSRPLARLADRPRPLAHARGPRVRPRTGRNRRNRPLVIDQPAESSPPVWRYRDLVDSVEQGESHLAEGPESRWSLDAFIRRHTARREDKVTQLCVRTGKQARQSDIEDSHILIRTHALGDAPCRISLGDPAEDKIASGGQFASNPERGWLGIEVQRPQDRLGFDGPSNDDQEAIGKIGHGASVCRSLGGFACGGHRNSAWHSR